MNDFGTSDRTKGRGARQCEVCWILYGQDGEVGGTVVLPISTTLLRFTMLLRFRVCRELTCRG